MYIFIYFIRNDGLIMQYITLLPNNWISDQFGITTIQTLHLQSLQITFKKKYLINFWQNCFSMAIN